MELQMNAVSQKLLDNLLNVPPNFSSASRLIQTEAYSAEDITKVAICYAEACMYNVGDLISENSAKPIVLDESSFPDGIIPGLTSTYLYDVIKFLLPHGVDANAVFSSAHGQYNLMDSLFFVDNEYVAADTLLLLLENGGNPNLIVDGESIYDRAEFEVWFGSIEQTTRWAYDAWMHLWFVLLAFREKIDGKDLEIQLFREYGKNERFNLKKLRDHRNFYYGLSHEGDKRIVHIYDRKTFWEVARW